MRNDIDTDYFKRKLEEERDILHEQLQKVGRQNPNNPEDWKGVPDFTVTNEADPNDVADKIENFEENSVIAEELEVRYNEVLDALKRIEAGAYGICEASGEPIEADRLEANPSARTNKAHMNDL
ncbi:MAG: TraR/DksA C4-type zinc finger protein [Candidatus Paceibacterota bacterium]